MSSGPGPLLTALGEASVWELMINEDGSVYAEREGGAVSRLNLQASADDARAVLKALLPGLGELGPSRPWAEATAADGSRVHVVGPPLTRGGLCLNIRKRPARRPSLDELVAGGALTPACAGFLRLCVESGRSLLAAGGASSGKTTLLNALAALVDPRARLLVLEDTPELSLPQPHVLYLKTCPPHVTLRDLVRSGLRMRPDRLIVGECRGGEAADLLEAMNVGVEGVMGTLHASSCREALQRLETLLLSSQPQASPRTARSSIALAVDLLVFVGRLADGSRRVLEVHEVTGLEAETITTTELFKREVRPGGAGELKATGALPRFYEDLRRQGREPPLDFFRSN